MTEKSEKITVRLAADEAERMRERARQTRETYSAIVRRAVTAMLASPTVGLITDPDQPIIVPPGHSLNIWANARTGAWAARIT